MELSPELKNLMFLASLRMVINYAWRLIVKILMMVVDEANSIFKKIAENDPNFKKKAYDIFSSRFGQCNLTPDVYQLLKEFPESLEPIEVVVLINDLLKQKKAALKDGKSVSEVEKALKAEIEKLKFRDDVKVELRWNPGTLDYELMQKVAESEYVCKKWSKSPVAPVLFNVNEFFIKMGNT